MGVKCSPSSLPRPAGSILFFVFLPNASPPQMQAPDFFLVGDGVREWGVVDTTMMVVGDNPGNPSNPGIIVGETCSLGVLIWLG